MRAATADGTHLWLTTSNDTNDEKVLRVPFDPATATAPAAACGSAAPARPAGRPHARPAARDRARHPGPPGQGAALQAGPQAGEGVQAAPARPGAARPGSLSITVERPGIRRKRARVKVLDGKATTRAGKRAAVTTKLSRKSRRLLRDAARRKGRLKLTLRVGLRTADKRLTTGKRTITILRR